jgi:hypothetical protein
MLHESLGLKPINVRLCGSIPRKELGNVVEDDNGDSLVSLRGAPSRLPDYLAASGHGPSYFATTNGSTLDLCDGLSGIVSQPNNRGTAMQSLNSRKRTDNGIVVTEDKPLGPVVLEPPKWAVPAKGETRLEVS